MQHSRGEHGAMPAERSSQFLYHWIIDLSGVVLIRKPQAYLRASESPRTFISIKCASQYAQGGHRQLPMTLVGSANPQGVE